MLCFLLVKGNIFERFAMDNRYSRHNSCLSSIGRRKSFGLMAILLVV
jgi:hypothetical protein